MEGVPELNVRSVLSTISIAILTVASILYLGCTSDDGTDLPPRIWHDYETSLVVPVSTDSVHVAIGTVANPQTSDPIEVFVNTAPSTDGLLRFDLRIVGESYDQTDRAVVEYRWSSDTLQVWCGLRSPFSWENVADLEKTTPKDLWFVPKRVDVSVPDGVQFRYLERWFE